MNTYVKTYNYERSHGDTYDKYIFDVDDRWKNKSFYI